MPPLGHRAALQGPPGTPSKLRALRAAARAGLSRSALRTTPSSETAPQPAREDEKQVPPPDRASTREDPPRLSQTHANVQVHEHDSPPPETDETLEPRCASEADGKAEKNVWCEESPDVALPPTIHRNVVRASIKLGGYKMSDSKKRGQARDMYLVISQDGTQLARTNVCIHSAKPEWKTVRLAASIETPLVVECWSKSEAGGESLIGSFTAQVGSFLSKNGEFDLVEVEGTKTVGKIRVNECKTIGDYTAGSVVNMLQREVFIREGNQDETPGQVLERDQNSETQLDAEHAELGHKPEESFYCRFKAFRVFCLDRRLAVQYSTVAAIGTAVTNKHYLEKTGVVEFAPGQAVAHFDITIPDDDNWEPVRDFVVQLQKVVQGQGTIGVLDSTIANIVDDDVRSCKHAFSLSVSNCFSFFSGAMIQ